MNRFNNNFDSDQDPEEIKNRLVELDEAVHIHQQILDDLGEILKTRNLQIARLEKSLQAKETALTVFQQTLSDIVNSRSWKLLRRLIQWLDKIFPLESRRRKALRRFFSIFIH